MQRKAVSIYVIAEKCGVSPSTVSRVLNDSGRISEDVQKKVLATAEALEYPIKSKKLSALAASETRTSSKTVGLVVSDVTNEHFASIVQEIEKYFSSVGYTTLICNTDSNPHKETVYIDELVRLNVAGLIVATGYNDTSESLKNLQIPTVIINRGAKTSGVHYVFSDNYEGGQLAARELYEKGCRRILLLTRNYFSSTTDSRVQGFLDELTALGIQHEDELIANIFAERSTYAEAADAVLSKLRKGIAFDGIFATNDIRAVGALQALQSQSISVPEDVKLVGFDGSTMSQATYPVITTVLQDREKMAEVSSRMLYNLMQGTTEDVPEYIMLPVRLLKGEST